MLDLVQNYPFVAIIIQNKNGKNDTLECLDSLRSLNYPKSRIEIIVVDADSSDGSEGAIKRTFKRMENEGWHRLILIGLDYDNGVPHSYNTALRKVNPKCKYIWKLDNDVIVDKDSLPNLIKVGETSEKVGIVGGKILYYHKPMTIWCTQASFLWWLGAGRHVGKNKKDGLEYNLIKTSQYLPGCSILIRKKLIDLIGGFCEDYFVYFDDSDICFQSSKKGYLNVYVPTARIWHKAYSTTSKESKKFVYYRTRNSFIFIRRNFSALHFVLYLLIFSSILFPFKILKYIFTNNHNGIEGLFKGILDGLKYKF